MANTTTLYEFKANLKQLDELNKKLALAKANLKGLKIQTAAYAALTGKIDGLTKSVAKNKDGIAGLNGSAKTLNKTGNKMIGIFRSASIAIVSAFAFRAIIGGIRGVVKTFADFESQMAAVKAITGATDAEFKKLEDSARQLGASTVFTATQVGQLQEEYARLGFTTEEILAAQNGTLALAAGTGESLKSSAETAGSVLRAFGIEASQTGRVVDIMGAAFTSSALNLERFTQSMKFVAPVARAAGFTIEETSAQLAILANNGLSGSLAGNALKNIFLRLGDANSKLNKKLGGTVQGLPQLIEALKGLKDETFGVTEATELLDKRSAPAFLTLLENIDGLEGSLDTLNKAEGSIAKMAAIRLNTLEGDFTLLKSATEGLGIAIGETFNVSLRNSIDELTGWVQELSQSDATLSNLRLAVNTIVLAFRNYIIVFGGMKAATIAYRVLLKPVGLGIRALAINMGLYTSATVSATAATNAFKVALTRSGIGIFVVILATAIEAIMSYGDEVGEAALMQERLNDAIRKDINSSQAHVQGSLDRTNALRELKQNHGDMLENYDVEILTKDQLVKLNKLLTETEQIRMDIATLEDLTESLTDEQKAKERLLQIDEDAIRLALDRNTVSQAHFDLEMNRIEIERQKIKDNAKDVSQNHIDLLKQKREELKFKMSTDKETSDFRILKDKTTRLKLRDSYKKDLENFRSMNAEKQKINLAETESELTRLKLIQEGQELQHELTKQQAAEDTKLINQAQINYDNFIFSLMENDQLKLFQDGNKEFNKQGQELNIIIQEMETKVTNLNAALKRGGDAFKDGDLSAFRLQKTKDNFDKLVKLRIANIKDTQKREIENAKELANIDINKFKKQLSLNQANIKNINIQQDKNEEGQVKADIKFLEANKNKFEFLKKLTILGWEEINAETDKGQTARKNAFAGILDEELKKLQTNKDAIIQAELKAENEINIILERQRNDNALNILQKQQFELDKENEGLLGIFKINKQQQKLIGDLKKEETDNNQNLRDLGEISEAQFQANKLAIAKKATDSMNALEDERLAKVGEIYSQMFSIVSQFVSNQAEVQEKGIKDSFERESLDRQNKFDAELAQAEAAGQDTEAMQRAFDRREIAQEKIKDEKLREIKRKLFIMEKTNSIISAVINGAVAITKVSSQTGIGAIAAAPLMSAFVAAQIGAIASQKFVGEQGGLVPSADDKFAKGGMVHGARHAQGGVKFAVGGRVAELEGGEAVINRKSTAMFKPQLSAMNVAGGGVAFESGGITPASNMALKDAGQGFIASDVAEAIAQKLNQQKVIVSESDISNSQSNVQVQESIASLF